MSQALMRGSTTIGRRFSADTAEWPRDYTPRHAKPDPVHTPTVGLPGRVVATAPVVPPAAQPTIVWPFRSKALRPRARMLGGAR